MAPASKATMVASVMLMEWRTNGRSDVRDIKLSCSTSITWFSALEAPVTSRPPKVRSKAFSTLKPPTGTPMP